MTAKFNPRPLPAPRNGLRMRARADSYYFWIEHIGTGLVIERNDMLRPGKRTRRREIEEFFNYLADAADWSKWTEENRCEWRDEARVIFDNFKY